MSCLKFSTGTTLLLFSLAANSLTLSDGTKVEELTGDDRWGCEVLLCLANPNGPRAVSECKPPIDRLFRCLSKRHPCKFPSCPMAGDGNYAKQLKDSFDPCSIYGKDYHEASEGYLAKFYDENSKKSLSKYEQQYGERKGYLPVGFNYNGEKVFPDGEGGTYIGGSKACVKSKPKVVRESFSCEYGICYRTVYVYDDILWQSQKSRRAIDVYIDGKIFNRVHW